MVADHHHIQVYDFGNLPYYGTMVSTFSKFRERDRIHQSSAS